jgi:hypothetical protein
MELLIGFLHADTPKPIATLEQKIQAACQSCDLQAIKACYDLNGASQQEIDTKLSVWKEYFGQNGDNRHTTFLKMEYRSLNDMLNDPTINPRSIKMMSEPHKMGESLYEPNLKVIGFITVTFKDASSSIGTVQAVGIIADGVARLSMDRAVK